MRKKVLIIGGGFGGLATAVRLASQGLDVELYEKQDKVGGRACAFEINEFTFDAGPEGIAAPFLLDELFTQAGRKREDYFNLAPVEPFYRIFDAEGRHFDLNNDPSLILNQVESWSPEDKAGCEKFFAGARAMFAKGSPGFSNRPILHATDLLKIVPDLLRLRSFTPAYPYVSRFVKNEFLRKAFSFHPLLVGGNPLKTPSIYALPPYLEREWGIFTAPGGNGKIIDALGKLLVELGGKIYLNTEAVEILVEGRKVSGVRLKDGSLHRAELVVSNADVAWTYKNLIPARARRVMTDRRLNRYQYSQSVFVIYFGTRRRYLDSPLARHNILLGQRYREWLTDLFDRKRLGEDFSLFLHMPTADDPSLAPEGCEAFTAICPVPHLGSGIDWSRAARPFRDRIMEFLERQYLPDLQANLIAEHYIDPPYFENTLNSYLGAAFSIAPTLGQLAWFRPHNRSEEFDNLYFTGQGTHPGAGLPGVLSSAKIVAQLILEQG